ncbi:MAG: sulfatase [Rikenellaceae bacterium]
MKRILLPTLFACGGFTAWAQQPNIIFFIVDDMGWQDCSLPMWKDTTALNRLFQTPNLERLADQGAKFPNAYASAVSSPTRVSLMTGMNPTSHRVSNWTLRYDQSTDNPSNILDFPQWNVNGLQPVGANVPRSIEANTLPELLRDNGYHTIHVGKAHFGSIDTPGEEPLNLGFDANVAGHAAGGLASYLGEENFGNRTDGQASSLFAVPGLEQYWGEDIFVTEALTIEAIKELDKARESDKPFYLYMSHYGIHVPFNADNRYYQKYIDQGLSKQWAMYASMVEGVDKSLGDLMDYLEREGIADETIIIYMSDNGGLSVAGREPHPITGSRVNYPLNSGKGSAFEGGVRVPLVVSLPDDSKQGLTIPHRVDVSDMLPTVLSMAQVKKYKTVQKIDGIDFSPMISDEEVKVKDRTFYWHFPCKWDAEGAGIGTYSMILDGDWKLIYYYNTGETMLFNVTEDISEIVDQSKNPQYSKLCNDLAKSLTKYLRKNNAQMPQYKDGSYCDYPDGSHYHVKEI